MTDPRADRRRAVRDSLLVRTIPDLLVACARRAGDAVVIAEGTRQLTGEQLLDRARRGADLLGRRGVRAGEMVAVDAGSQGWSDVAAAYFAVTWLGATAMLVDVPPGSGRDLLGARRMITAAEDAGAMEVISPAELREAPPPERPAEPAARPNGLVDIVYTAGTTGTPKPVRSTHAQWIASLRTEMMAARPDRAIAHRGVPISVSGGVHGILLSHLARGATSVCARTPGELAAAAAAWGARELHLEPHAAKELLHRSVSLDERWAAAVRTVRIVGGPLPVELGRSLMSALPNARIVSFYGLTEAGAAQCMKVFDPSRPDSIGRPLPGTELRIVDQEGEPVPRGEVGELQVRTTGVRPPQYHGNDALNAAAYDGDWVRTGDLAAFAEDGEVRLVGRSKELLILKGGRIAPHLVEDILARSVPDDVEFAVVGVTGDQAWDEIAVCVAGSREQPQVAAAVDALGRVRGPFRPALIRLVERIPRGASGKPLRRVLAEQLQS